MSDLSDKKLKILLFGPVTNTRANLVGGATISFGYLTDYLHRNQYPVVLVNTQKWLLDFRRYFNPFYVLIKALLSAPFTQVIFLNSSRGGTKYLAPILYLLAKLTGNKFIFRPFGGDIKDYTAGYAGWQKWIFNNTILKADIFFLQTQELLDFYADSGANIIQLSTSRDRPPVEVLRGDRPYQKRFIYLGYINEAKGINHLLAAAKILSDDYCVHIYGPIKEDKFQKIFDQHPGIYQGVLEKEAVLPTLQKYDVLVLPTYYEGEGYPGAIVEAYSLGLPVISTQWKAIPEIVEQEQTGRLIMPQSTDALVDAMRFFTVENYPEYSNNASNYFSENFDADQVAGKAIDRILALMN